MHLGPVRGRTLLAGWGPCEVTVAKGQTNGLPWGSLTLPSTEQSCSQGHGQQVLSTTWLAGTEPAGTLQALVLLRAFLDPLGAVRLSPTQLGHMAPPACD